MRFTSLALAVHNFRACLGSAYHVLYCIVHDIKTPSFAANHPYSSCGSMVIRQDPPCLTFWHGFQADER